jgi:GAF domain-containing protein
VSDEAVADILTKLGQLAGERDPGVYLRRLVELCSQATGAERATVFLVDQKKKELSAKVAQQTAVEIRLPLGRGLAGHVAATGETINVPDAYADPRFDRSVDQRTGFRTLNALVVPVWGDGAGRVVGVIQVLNKQQGAFERQDQMILERIAETVGPLLKQMQTAEVGD